MTPKQRKTITVCLIILAISMAVMAISTIINLINNGWEAFNMVSFVPFIGMTLAMIVILESGKKENEK